MLYANEQLCDEWWQLSVSTHSPIDFENSMWRDNLAVRACDKTICLCDNVNNNNNDNTRKSLCSLHSIRSTKYITGYHTIGVLFYVLKFSNAVFNRNFTTTTKIVV